MSEQVPEGWEVKRLGDIGKVVTGSTPNTKETLYWSGKVPFVSPADFNGGVFVRDTERTVTKLGAEKGRVLPKDSILVTCIGSLGGIAMSSEVCVTNQQINAIIPNENYNNRYCYYNVLFHIDKLEKYAGTTTLPIINKSTFEGISVPFPPVPEQKKIASILTSVDEVIEKTQSHINKLQDLKKGTMNELLTRGIGHTEFKDSPVGRIPKGWEVVELKENLSFISYGFTNPMSESEVGPLMITARDIVDGHIVVETARRTTYKEYNELLTDKSRPKLGDILLTKDGTLGRVAIVDREGICIAQSVAVLRPNDTGDTEFLYHLLSTPIYQKEMLDKAGGSTIKHIYITVVDKMQVVSPPLDEQQQIASILSSIDTNIEEKQQKLQQTQFMKKSLMQGLLTGKVRVAVH